MESHQTQNRQLIRTAIKVLISQLGMAHAMRFVSLVRNPMRDYLAWRDEQFKNLTANELIDQLRAMPKGQ